MEDMKQIVGIDIEKYICELESEIQAIEKAGSCTLHPKQYREYMNMFAKMVNCCKGIEALQAENKKLREMLEERYKRDDEVDCFRYLSSAKQALKGE